MPTGQPASNHNGYTLSQILSHPVQICAGMWVLKEAVDLCGGNVYTHYIGQCQLFVVQFDELWVVSMSDKVLDVC